MAGLDELALALRQGAQGKKNLAGLDEQYARGVALRDGATAKMDRYGQVSPLAVLADVIGSSQGRKQLRELKPQREAARQAVAENASALPLFKAKSALEARGEPVSFVNPDGTGLVTGYKTKGGLSIGEGEDRRIVDIDGKVDYRYYSQQLKDQGASVDARTKTRKEKGYQDNKANREAQSTIAMLGDVDHIIELQNNLSPSTLKRIGGLLDTATRTVAKGILPEKIDSIFQEAYEADPQVKQYRSALAGLSAQRRHELFGATLTKMEAMSANEFISYVFNLPPEEHRRRLNNAINKGVNFLRAGDSSQSVDGEGDKYITDLTRLGYKNLGLTPAEPQAGSVNAIKAEKGKREKLREMAREDPEGFKRLLEDARMKKTQGGNN